MNAVNNGQAQRMAHVAPIEAFMSGTPPVINAIIDDYGSTTGIIEKNGYTDDERPEIIGKGSPGDTVHVYDGGELLGRAKVGADGSWSFTPVLPLANGKHSISIILQSLDGDISDPSEPYVIFVDKVPPQRPTIDEVNDDVGAVTGPVSNGGTTDDNTPTLSGKAEAGAAVVIIDNGKVIGEVIAGDDGSWNFTPGAELADGPHQFEVMARDKAGNESEHSERHTISIVSRVPTQVATVTVMGKDWGTSGVDWLTNDGNAGRLMQGVLSATLAADERLQVSTDGGLSWVDASVDGLRWAAQDNNGHSISWSIQTQVVNAGGRTGPVTTKDVMLDTLRPDPPTAITTEGSYLRVAFNKSAVAGDIVSVLLDGKRFDHTLTAQEVASGSARIYPGFAVTSGNVMAAIVDQAGNASKYLDQGQYKLIDFETARFTNLGTGQSTYYNGLRITAEVDYDVWQLPNMVSGITSHDPAVYTGMKIGISGRTRIDFTEGAISELKFLVTNLQVGSFAPSIAKFYSASGALVGQLTLSATWPNSLNASFKAPAGQEFSYMVVSTGYKVPGYKGIGSYDWIGLDNFEMRGGTGKLNVVADQTIQGNTGTYYGGAEDNVFSLVNVAYLTAATSGGVAGGDGVDTLKLTGANQVLDLSVLKDKIDSIEIFDITGSGKNTLKMSIADVMNDGGRNQFIGDGNVQLMVKGDAGDKLVLGAMIDGAIQGEWQLLKQVSVNGVSYDVYKHSVFAAEVLVKQGVEVQMDMSLLGMGKDSGIANDYVTSDGGAGRLIHGALASVLPAGAGIQVSTDGGSSWGNATVKDGQWFFTDMQAHSQSWSIQARVIGASGAIGQMIERHVELSATPGAPSIARIAEAEGVLTATEASNGVDMLVALDGTAKVGDLVHIQWGIATYHQALTALDIASGQVTVKVPASATRSGLATAQGVAYDFDVTASIVSNGMQGPASPAYRVIGGGFATKALSDALNVANVVVVDNTYTGNGVKVSSDKALLSKTVQTTSTLAGLTIAGDDPVAHFALTAPATRFQLTLSGLNNAAGGATIIVYGVDGSEIKREVVLGTLSSNRYVKTYIYTAAEGVDVGSFDIIPASGSLTLSTFSQTQALHALDVRNINNIDELADTYYGTAADDVITLSYAAASHLASTANKGIHGGDGIDTLKIATSGQVLNLNLATSAGKLSGVEIIDLTGTGNNTLTLSLKDVLANGQVDLFHEGSKSTVQMMVKGNAGDIVNLDDLLGAGGVDLGDWAAMGRQSLDGVSYVVYQHSGLDAELLVQDAVRVNLI